MTDYPSRGDVILFTHTHMYTYDSALDLNCRIDRRSVKSYMNSEQPSKSVSDSESESLDGTSLSADVFQSTQVGLTDNWLQPQLWPALGLTDLG